MTNLGDWATDVVAVPHNALRAEMADLTSMVAVLQAGGTAGVSALIHAVHSVAQWWAGFEQFWREWGAFENDVLLPWIYRGNDVVDNKGLRSKMEGHAAYVNELALEVANVFVLFDGARSLDVVPLLLRCVTEFVDGLLAFLDLEEKVLPALIREGHTNQEAFNVTKLMCRRVDIVLLTRWLGERRDRIAFRRMYMTPASWITFYARRKRVYVDHLAMVLAVCGPG